MTADANDSSCCGYCRDGGLDLEMAGRGEIIVSVNLHQYSGVYFLISADV
jgi:hypothetical protein